MQPTSQVQASAVFPSFSAWHPQPFILDLTHGRMQLCLVMSTCSSMTQTLDNTGSLR